MSKHIDYSTFAANPYGALSKPLDFETNLRVEDTAQRILNGTYSPPSSESVRTVERTFCPYCGAKTRRDDKWDECPKCGAPTE